MTVADLERLRNQSEWLRVLARRLVGAAAADDLAQDAALIALESPPPDDRPLGPWLVRVLRNTARMRFRADGRRARREQGLAGPAAPVAPDAAVQLVETHRALCELVLALDEPFRRTIVAHYFEGVSLAELARREGVVDATVRWRHARALALVRDGLDRRAGGNRAAWTLALAPLAKLPPAPPLVLGAMIMNKVAIAAAVAVAATAGTALWWRSSRAHSAPSSALSSAGSGAPAASAVAPPTPAPGTAAGAAPSARPPTHVVRLASPAQRRELADRIAAAQARRRAAPPAAPAAQGSDAMETSEQVLGQIRTALVEVEALSHDCVTRTGTSVAGFRAGLTLTGDADVGTLIDASGLSSLDATPLPPGFDACVRDLVLSLELPPIAVGHAFKITYEMTYDDDTPAAGSAAPPR